MFSIIIEVFTFATKAVYTPSDQFSVVNKQTNKQTKTISMLEDKEMVAFVTISTAKRQ